MADFNAQHAAAQLSGMLPSGPVSIQAQSPYQGASQLTDLDWNSLEDVMALLKQQTYKPGGAREPRESTNIEDRRGNLSDAALSLLMSAITPQGDEKMLLPRTPR